MALPFEFILISYKIFEVCTLFITPDIRYRLMQARSQGGVVGGPKGDPVGWGGVCVGVGGITIVSGPPPLATGLLMAM